MPLSVIQKKAIRMMASSIYRLEGSNQAEIAEMKGGEHGGYT
jgi:hypothetical protein